VQEHIKNDQNKLRDIGYSESVNKPNLFYKPLSNGGAVFADMRTSGIIWVWVKSKDKNWWNVRTAEREFENLQLKRFYSRLELSCSYGNGYCERCGKDFQDNGSYCSDECERIVFYENFITTYNPDICELCGEYVYKGAEKHHTSYYPEITILLHHKCHRKIHYTDLYPHLKPPNSDGKDFYNNVKKPDNWIKSGIKGMELKATHSARASCFPRPNLNWNRAAKTEIDIKYDIVYRKRVTKPHT